MTSTETTVDHAHNNNNNNNNNNTTKYTAFEDLRNKCHQQQTQQAMDTTDSPPGHVIMPGLTQLDSKVGNSSDIKPDKDDNKCFICKVNFLVAYDFQFQFEKKKKFLFIFYSNFGCILL